MLPERPTNHSSKSQLKHQFLQWLVLFVYVLYHAGLEDRIKTSIPPMLVFVWLKHSVVKTMLFSSIVFILIGFTYDIV